jgi:hypothetical protein
MLLFMDLSGEREVRLQNPDISPPEPEYELCLG